MAYGSARYSSYQKKKKKKDISQVTSSSAGFTNKGGLLGGIEYVGGKIIAAPAKAVEVLGDAALAGIAALGGDLEYAKYVFKDNVVGDWQQSLDAEYNPSGAMRIVGDISNSISQVFTNVGIASIPYVGVPLLYTSFISSAISDAAAETGEVGWNEVGYGVTTGTLEGILNTTIGASGQILKGFSSEMAKKTGSTALKSVFSSATRKGLAGKIISEATGEFFEEAASEVADVYIQRLWQINPEAKVVWKDVLYAGALGAISGGVAGSVDVIPRSIHNRSRGQKIIQRGNAQTLVNTANLVADKLAGQGTNFKKAPEWVKTLRGEVDAYNKLKAEDKIGAKGQTILGEMQASLYCAETQAIAHGLTETIRKSSEQNRATLAEYINMSVDKKNRTRDYTAEDIANDTDGITHWLAVMQFAGNDFINYDAALMDEADENAINEKIAKEQAGAESNVEGAYDQYDLKDAIKTLGDYDDVRKRHIESNGNDKISRDYNDIADFINNATKHNPVKRLHIGVVNSDVSAMVKAKTNIDITDYDFVIASNFIAHIFDEHGNPKTETSRGQIAVNKSNIEDIIETVIQPDDVSVTTDNQGARALKFEKDINGRNVAITITSTKKSTLTLKSAWIINKRSGGRTPSANANTFAGTPKTNGRSSTKPIIHQNEPKVNPDDKKISDKRDLTEKPAKTAQESANKSDKADEAKTKEKSTGAKDEGKAAKKTETPSPSPDGDTSPEGRGLEGESNKKTSPEGRGEAHTDENTGKAERSEKPDGREKARERAEKLLKWNEEQRPTVKELNDAREYVKGFDNLEISRRLAIIRMIRSAEGNVDKKILKGVANIMAAVPKADIEIRFADGIGGDKGGLYTHIGNKTLLVIDRGTDFKNTIQGTIAHELVHYLENRAGYKAFAEYVMKRVKPEMKAKVTKQYTEYYRGLFTAQFMKGEGDVEGKYDLDESFGKQLQDWKQGNGQANGLYNGKYFRLGTTPNVLIKHGAPAGEVIMFEDCLLKITGLKHSISLDELSKIPSQLNDPILLFKGSVENSFVALTEIKDKSGNDVIVAVHINKKLGRSVINKITSVYSKTDDYGNNKINNYVTEQIKKGNLLDASAKKAPNWFTTSGLQLPHVVQTILDANNSISQKHDIVNPTEQKNQKNNLSGEENIPEEIKARVEAKLASREFQELIESEIVAKYVGKALNNEKLLRKYADKDKKFITRVGGWLARTVTSLKKNKDVDKETVKVADEMAFRVTVLLQSESTIESKDGVKFDLITPKDPAKLKEADFIDLLKEVKAKKLPDGSYIPARINTPQILIDFAKKFGYVFENLPIAIKVYKARQAVSNIREWDGNPKDTPHDLSPEEIVSIVRSMDDPKYLVFQTKNERFAEIVEFNVGGEKAYAIIDFYDIHKNQEIMNHYAGGKYNILVTVYPSDNDQELSDYLKNPNNRVMSGEKMKKKGSSQRGLGSYVPAHLNDSPFFIDSIHQNEPVVNTSEEKNIDKADLADTKADLSDKPKKADKVSELLNEQGEVKDEFFEAAVLRSLGNRQEAEETAESRKERAEKMIETRKTKFNKLIANAEKIKRKLEGFGKDADPELIKKTKKQYSDILFELGSLQRDMRMMGYDLNAENRLIEQQKKQIENQKEQIKTLKQQKAELERIEREDRIMRDLDKREAARAARLYAKQKADFGKVFNEKEIKGHINDMLERGLISQFFGGQYKPNLDNKTINGIAEYIAMQLNLLGTAEGKAAGNIIFAATNDIVKHMTFTDADSGQELYLDKIVDKETMSYFSDAVSARLEKMFQNIGTVNAYSELMRRYKLIKQEYLDKGKQAKEKQEWGREFPKTYQAALKIRKLAAQGKATFADSVSYIAKELGKIVDESGHLHFGRIDAAMRELLVFFEGEDMKTQSERARLGEDARVTDDALSWTISPVLRAEAEQFVRLREGREGQMLTAEELQLVGDILRGMKTTIERYNKEYVGSHLVDVDQAAVGEVSDLATVAERENNKEYKTKIGELLGGKIGKGINEIYFYKILSPETVLSALEAYRKGGLLQAMYHSVREAQARSNTMWVRMLKPFEEFLDAKGEIEVEVSGEENGVQNHHTSNESRRLTEDDLQQYIHAGTRENKSKLSALQDGKKIILVNENEITDFINKSIKGEKDLNTVAYGQVSNRLAKEVDSYSKGKIKINDYYLELVPNDVGHAYKEHINAKQEGDIDLSEEDFRNIPRYLDEYDDLVYAIRFENGNTRICVSKKLHNGRVVLIETVSKSRGSVEFKNMIGVSEEKYISDYVNKYKKGNSSNTGGSQGSNISPHDITVSTNSISQNSSNVKRKTKKVSVDPTWIDSEGKFGRAGKKYSYRDKLNVKKISINGREVTLGEGINLFMLTKREAAHAGLLENGFVTYDKEGKKHLIKIEDIAGVRDLIYRQLDKADLAFLEMAERFFNETASKIKYDADMKIFGFSNNAQGYYVPMVRDRYSRTKGVTDARFSVGEVVSLYMPSFGHNLVANAHALEGQNIMSLIENHARGLADYSELYLPLKAFDRIYNRGVATADGNITSIREILNTEIWSGSERYLKDLFSDIQHQRDSRDNVVDKTFGWLRSAWVNSVLGANIKVVATQTTSLGAATQVIEPKYITQASIVIGKRDVSELRERAYKYSNIIEARNFDMGALKAQGNIDKISRIGEKSGYLIGWMDDRVCLSIFHAAELKVQDQDGLAVGTEKNAKRAAEIADKAIFTTQAMSDATERSALQRSTSEIGKLFSMFTSDTVKNLSHLWGNVMKYRAHKARADAGEAGYVDMLKQDKAELGRSVRTLAITGVMMGLIAQGFKYLYAKEEEEPEEKMKDLALDVVSSTLNILPIFSDFADKLFLDYDMSLNVLDVANDTLETLGNSFKLAGKAISGQYVSAQDVKGTVVNVAKSGLSLVGVPVAPVERTVTGLLRRFSPSAIYGYDAMFYNPSYTADLKKAVESGDEALAEHILSSLYKNEVAGVYASDELEEVARLYSLTNNEGKHYDVLPQKVAAEVNGVKLTRAQRRQFNAIYSQASAEVLELIGSPYYQGLTDAQRAKAIKSMYSLYYSKAASEVTGKEWSNAEVYSYLTSNYSALFSAQAYKSGLEAVKDANGKEVSVRDQFVSYLQNLGLSESDYTIVAYANGVRDKTTRAALLEHINSLPLTDEEKAAIAERLSLEVKNGKVVEKRE